MLLSFHLIHVLPWLFIAAANGQGPWPCGTCTNESPEPILPVPAPWELDCSAYAIPFAPVLPLVLPSKAYSPLEKNSSATEGTFLGLAGTILIVRYTDTPVGPYDELALVPGTFGYTKPGPLGVPIPKIGIRGSRFYVSQKYTNWNGRINWNIPKHLARFDWTTDPSTGAESLKLYPFDTTTGPVESGPSALPFFQMTFKPLSSPVPLPVNTDIFAQLGLSPGLIQGPVPEGNGLYDELPGTAEWAETLLSLRSNASTAGVFDMAQGAGDQVGNTGFNAVGDEYYPNFWPGIGQLHPGIKIEKAVLTFPVADKWA